MMKRKLFSFLLLCLALTIWAQEGIQIDPSIDADFAEAASKAIQVPASPITTQVLFSEGDLVSFLDYYADSAGMAPAKGDHDFIGITPDGDDFWITVNHESRDANEALGDGGGMTTFKVTRNQDGTLEVVETTMPDGRTALFHNVDFVNTVGPTWTNCGGIIAPDGRIWTAEEYPRVTSWGQGNEDVMFLKDTGDVIIGEGYMLPFNDPTPVIPGFEGQRLKKYENQGWMVEIDPVTARAIRKQYNWGRMSFEAGAIMPDMKTVFLAEDERPGILVKFVADTPGDFTEGDLFVYKQDGGDAGNWLQVDNTDLETMVNLKEWAWENSATLFIRLEWVTEIDGKVYICETGYDNVNKKSSWTGAIELAGVDAVANHHKVRAADKGTQFTVNDETHYYDYYGRILVYDPDSDEISVFLEGGPEYGTEQSQTMAEYPEIHLTNPDGLGKIQIGNKWYMIINEDLNGSTYNRLPSDFTGWACEMYALDMDIENPSLDDLVRVAVGPNGAELTGGNGTQDGKSILVDIQHPSNSNTAPYNHAMTVAINGFSTLEDLHFDLDWTKNDVLQTKADLGMTDEVAFINDAEQLFEGERLKTYENQGWMVEIDPATAKAIRKQYNWGRMSFEAGCMMPDMKTAYFAEDERPGLFTKFVADEAGDFTSGKLYVFKQDGGTDGNWLEVDNTDFETMVKFKEWAWANGATYFIRLEWLTEVNGRVYIAETGYDNVNKKTSWQMAIEAGSVDQVAQHHQDRAAGQETQFVTNDETHYYDYYGRILEFDPATDEISVYLEGGPDYASEESQTVASYPAKHLSNPDGLGKINVGDQWYLILNEDLNGSSYNRVPSDGAKLCEMFALDMSIADPTIDDLVRLGVGPAGSELTGGNGTQDGKSILVDIQHPSSSNTPPYDHALTLSLNNFNTIEDLAFEIDWAADSIFQSRYVKGTSPETEFINTADPLFEGERLERFESQGWMVEIDPATAKAIRKQYNWGRMSFEAGCIMPDNQTVYLAEDERPGLFTKFVATTPGDFTSGDLYVFKQDGGTDGNWIKMDNDNLEEMVNLKDSAWVRSATLFIRLEWITEINGKVYIAETGYDNVNKKSSWTGAVAIAGEDAIADHHRARATAQGTQFTVNDETHYYDYYGRILEYDPVTDQVSVYLEGGPDYATEQSQTIADYPVIHLANPDGLGKIELGGKWYMIINEDLNGTTYNRVPSDGDRLCEMYALDMTIANPAITDLIRLGVGPAGSELTGGNGTQDGLSLLVDIQHPSSSNAYPFNHASTVAIDGFTTIEELEIETNWKDSYAFQSKAIVTDESQFLNTAPQLFEGESLKKYESQGWMVEIDPETAKAIRKQYNWGRMSFEAGCMSSDMSTVYLAEDERPGLLTKFVANTPGDFTSGTLYVFKQDENDPVNGNWIEIDNTDLETMVNLKDTAWAMSATLFIRLEWITEIDGKIYIAETGYDNVNKKSSWTGAVAIAGEDAIADHHKARATTQGTQFTVNDATHYYDYYGRILVYDPDSDEVSVYLEGGPDYATEQSQAVADYPDIHLSNPDGLGKITIGTKTFMVINEDLNGSSYNRLPSDFNGWACDMYLLDMDIENPSLSDLIRIGVGPNGSELTGGNGTQDGKSIMVDIQHPSSSNTAPFDNASTLALTGFDKVTDLSSAHISVDWAKNDVFQGPTIPEITTQVLFSGGVDEVTVVDTDGQPDGTAIAKQGHDFIGISEVVPGEYWISVNHETRNMNEKIGDGGGMTSFKVVREAATDTFQIVETTLADGRVGKFHNVDFVNTVGETWTNCGGIIAPDGRIWTAEEYPLITSWGQGNDDITGFISNMEDVIIGEGQSVQMGHVLFSGTIDTVQTVDTYSQPNGEAPAKEDHDFIGITEITPGEYLISVNHESREMNERIGDGGGMTSFKVQRIDGRLQVMEQTLADGRSGKFFNVDFANTVGETWTNCGGIIGPDGRIWTAEEYPLVKSWGQGNQNIDFLSNMNDVIIGEGVEADWTQVLFTGSVDMVQTLDTYGKPNGEAAAKEDHDFIGITEVGDGEFLISVNHESREINPMIGDGGGMTTFKIKNVGGQYLILDQELPDGRSGKFFNVDFANTVGETWTNCGGLIAPDGRIWTAEEYPLMEMWGQGNHSIDFISNMSDIIIGEGLASVGNTQVLFAGTVDSVEVVDYYGKPAGRVPAKEDHDFIGITEVRSGEYLVSVNHESRNMNDMIGDGGGMTSFLMKNVGGLYEIQEQELADGRTGKFFNVDFMNTVGETWTNCGGIIAPDGRIWTAEEYPLVESWGQGNSNITGFVKDTGYVIIGEGVMVPFNDPAPVVGFEGERLKAYEGQGWMVEIDPMTGKAIRKQYNWGRMSFEAGCIMPDNQTVYLAEDERPGILVKFVADTPGDFTSGSLYAFKQDGGDAGNWVSLDNADLDEMVNMKDAAWEKKATLFIRLEWITEVDGKVYIAETGYDNVNSKSSWTNAVAITGESNIANHHRQRAATQGTQLVQAGEDHYYDYYGRILVYDPATDEVSVYLEGGPDYETEMSLAMSEYPAKHLSNPDGLGKISVHGKTYLVINEDLNGATYNRIPSDGARICEMYLLDASIENPTIDDLTRIMVGPAGAELTGGNGTHDGISILVDVQHPSGSNTPPYDKAVTVALNGFDTVIESLEEYFEENGTDPFVIYPNPVYQTLYFNGTFDVKLYNSQGALIKYKDNTSHLNISELEPGVYYIRNNEGETRKLIKQ